LDYLENLMENLRGGEKEGGTGRGGIDEIAFVGRGAFLGIDGRSIWSC
jgi:hypothetical protein